MSDGIYSALSGAIAQQRALDVVANNVANASTDGFRADRVSFSEVLAPAADAPGGRPDALRYVAIAEVRMDDTAGPLRETGNPLDMALASDGYFAVETPQGVRYTRAGSFVRDGEGTLRTHAGHRVLGHGDSGAGGGGIVVPTSARDIQVTDNGTLRADGVEVGRVRIVDIATDQLAHDGLTLFRASGQPEAADSAVVLSGHIEGANVNAVAGLNELITTTRSFEAFQRVIQGFRQIDERTARDLGSR